MVIGCQQCVSASCIVCIGFSWKNKTTGATLVFKSLIAVSILKLYTIQTEQQLCSYIYNYPLASGYYGVHVHGSRNRNCGTNFPCLLHHGNIIYIVSWRVSYKVSTRLSRNASEPCFATREIAKGTLSYLPRGMLT